jgi:hypothetical protein
MRGLRIAAASSSKNANAFLERIRLDEFVEEEDLGYGFMEPGYTLLDILDANVSGRDFEQGKPHPEIFLTAAEELAVPPGECFVGGKSGVEENPGAWLGAAMGELANSVGRDKLTLVGEPIFAPLGVWIEQLAAESTGKKGKGIVPVESEPPGAPEVYGDDRLFVYTGADGSDGGGSAGKLEELARAGHPVVRIEAREPYDLGGEMLRWMMATAVAGHILAINPFDQPNVESAKVLARKMVAEYQEQGSLPQLELTLQEPTITVYAAPARRRQLRRRWKSSCRRLVPETTWRFRPT